MKNKNILNKMLMLCGTLLIIGQTIASAIYTAGYNINNQYRITFYDLNSSIWILVLGFIMLVLGVVGFVRTKNTD